MFLREKVGGTIWIRTPHLKNNQLHIVKLLSVDVGGIWIESETFTDTALKEVELTASPRTPVLFLPYSQIVYIISFEDVPSVSVEALGGTP